MKTRRLHSLLVLAVLVGAWLASAQSFGAEYREAASKNYFSDSSRGVNLETATEIVRKQTSGRVLSASPSSRGSESGYQVRVLVEDREVQTWFVDRKGKTRND